MQPVVKKPRWVEQHSVVLYIMEPIIPDLLAQVLLPLLTSGEMEGISGGAAGGDGCKEVGWSFPSST